MDTRSIVEIVTILLGAGVGYGVFKTTVDNLKGENAEQWITITKIRDWVAVHERDTATVRLDIERDISRLREDVSKSGGKMDLLISMIVDLSKKLDKLESKLEEGR